jgi:hypothetical protein
MLLVNFTHGIDRIGFVRTLVGAVSFDPRKAQDEATRVLGAGQVSILSVKPLKVLPSMSQIFSSHICDCR